jgi:hypothetical protein
MPSLALQRWHADRLPRLAHLDAQCAASLALTPPNPLLVDENFRGYVVLLSAHFQGFCRDLYAESVQTVVSRARPTLQSLFQAQFFSKLRLDSGNPNHQHIREDFERFGPVLDLAPTAADKVHLNRLAALNQWRNLAAHHGTVPASIPPLSLPLLRDWRDSCDWLARSLDGILYNWLRKILRRSPWTP